MVAVTKVGRIEQDEPSPFTPGAWERTSHAERRRHTAVCLRRILLGSTARRAGSASGIVLAAICGALLLLGSASDSDSQPSTAGIGFDSISSSLAAPDGDSAIDHGRSPHNLYRFSGARAAVASMAHGF